MDMNHVAAINAVIEMRDKAKENAAKIRQLVVGSKTFGTEEDDYLMDAVCLLVAAYEKLPNLERNERVQAFLNGVEFARLGEQTK